MAVETGYSKIVTRNSVFAYDTGDTVNSWKGQPITNQFTVQGTSGYGSGADNAVNFPVQGTVGFIRLGFGQQFGDYVIQQNDVVYKYNLNSNIGGCHYHGMVQSIPAGAYATFTFDYYISPDTNLASGNSTLLANFENYGGGALGGNVSMPNSLKGVWQTVSFTSGPRGGGVGSQAMFLYPGGCGGNIATNGYILFKNPRVYWLNYDVPFVQGTRSTTQGMIDIVGGNTIDLANMSYGANNAISFDGTDDYTDVATNFGVLNQYTIEHVSYKGSEGRMPVSYRTNTNYYQYGDYSWAYTHGGVWGEFYYNGSNWNGQGPINGWGHWVITYDGSKVSVYRRGLLTGTQNTTGTADWSGGLRIGYWAGGGAYAWNGQIAVVKFYNRALTASEVLSNFNHYKTRFNIT